MQIGEHTSSELPNARRALIAEGVEERWQRTWEEEGLYRAGAGTRRDETFAGPIGIRKLVFGEKQPRDRTADGDVVTRVGDEVDPDVPTERFE